jgi:hypothetical protein
MGAGNRMLEGRNGRNQFGITDDDMAELRKQLEGKCQKVSQPIKIVDDTYPNGTPCKMVFVGELRIGALACVDGGFKANKWRSAIASLDAAVKELRAAAIADRQKQIIQLQREIEALKD